MFFNSGNVGLGTNSPVSRLHVDGDLTLSKGGTTYVNTETNAYPMFFLKGPPYSNSTFGRIGLYGDTALLSDNAHFNLTNWVADNNAAARSVGLLQQGAIRFQTQVANGPDGLISRMIIESNGDVHVAADEGNVGIGTTAPASKLHVVGNVTVDGNIAAKYQDVAEWVVACRAMTAGTVVVISRGATNSVCGSHKSYDTAVAGVVSPQPGITGEPAADKVLVAQSGRLRVKADASYGEIHAGDLLVTSPTSGYAMRSKPVRIGGSTMHRPGTLIGKAIESLETGKGEILVLLTLQ